MKGLLLLLCLVLTGCGMSGADKAYLDKCQAALNTMAALANIGQISGDIKQETMNGFFLLAGLNPLKCEALLSKDAEV